MHVSTFILSSSVYLTIVSQTTVPLVLRADLVFSIHQFYTPRTVCKILNLAFGMSKAVEGVPTQQQF